MAEITYEQAMEALRKADAAGNVEDARRIAQIAKGLMPSPQVQVQEQEIPKVTESMSGTDKFLAGTGKAFVDTYQGLQQVGGQIGNAVGLVPDERLESLQSDIDFRKSLDEDLMDTGAGIAGNIVGHGVQYALPAGLVGKTALGTKVAANTLGKYAMAAGGGAAYGGAQSVGGDESRTTNALYGAAGGAIGQGVANTIGRIAAPSQRITPAVRELADKASKRGISIRADQLVNSKPMNVMSSALDYVPFSGSAAAKATQQKQFNRAIAQTIGENTDDIAQALKSAEVRLSSEFDSVLKNNAVKADAGFVDDLARITQDARNEMNDQQFSVIERQIQNIIGKVKSGDVIDADAAYNIKKSLDRVGKSNDSTLAHYARDLRGALMEALNRSLPDGGESFAKTRQQYSNLIELGKLVPRGAEPDISPARLANARNIKTKDLSELADIGAQFLKGRVADSGTAQRAGVYGMLGAGTMVDPMSVGVGLTVGRGMNALMGSGATQRYLYNGVPALQTVAKNSLLPAAGTAIAVRD